MIEATVSLVWWRVISKVQLGLHWTQFLYSICSRFGCRRFDPSLITKARNLPDEVDKLCSWPHLVTVCQGCYTDQCFWPETNSTVLSLRVIFPTIMAKPRKWIFHVNRSTRYEGVTFAFASSLESRRWWTTKPTNDMRGRRYSSDVESVYPSENILLTLYNYPQENIMTMVKIWKIRENTKMKKLLVSLPPWDQRWRNYRD